VVVINGDGREDEVPHPTQQPPNPTPSSTHLAIEDLPEDKLEEEEPKRETKTTTNNKAKAKAKKKNEKAKKGKKGKEKEEDEEEQEEETNKEKEEDEDEDEDEDDGRKKKKKRDRKKEKKDKLAAKRKAVLDVASSAMKESKVLVIVVDVFHLTVADNSSQKSEWFERLDENRWKINKGFAPNMKTEAIFYANDALAEVISCG